MLSKRISYVFGIIIVIYMWLLAAPASLAHAAVVINEIYPKPTDEQSEWIELYNAGNESVSLNLWKLENTDGEKKSFIINASAIIQPKGFLLFPKSQTGISMRNEGDTIRLIDQNNTTVDTQTFQGILGYNTSMGRTVDGAGAWATCTTATPEAKNACPEPSATPSPITIETPAATATAIPSPIPTIPQDSPTPIVEVVVVTHIPTPTPTSSETMTVVIPKTIGVQVLIVAVSWILLAVIALINTKKKKKHISGHSHHTNQEP